LVVKFEIGHLRSHIHKINFKQRVKITKLCDTVFRGNLFLTIRESLCDSTCIVLIGIIYLQDELLWGAAWLFRATNAVKYYNLAKSLGADDQPDIFSWDNKYAGAHVLLSRVS
jgi:hypothetical protein